MSIDSHERNHGMSRRTLLGAMGATGAGLAVAAGSPAVAGAVPAAPIATPRQDDPRLLALKRQVIRNVERRSKMVQEIVDSIFSFSELGFQETETARYLIKIMRDNGFQVEEGIAGIPTAWMATWGSGGPVISLGSDIDGIPRSNVKPGVLERDPLVDVQAPGHGEGHNSGMAAVIVGALAAKELMESRGIPGTLKVWPGVAEELLGTKAYYVREGYFDNVDVTLFNHVDTQLATSWGQASGNGVVSLEYTFRGSPGHGASAHLGRSALDAVQLMNAAMEYRREHLRVNQRMHFVIPDGGDQPNVVPEWARVWYYLREDSYERIMELWELADKTAHAAAEMSDTTLESIKLLGAAWPQHMNRPIAEAAGANMELVGMPAWSADDQTYARAVQEAAGVSPTGLSTEISGVSEPIPERYRSGGGSDDIGDVSWNTPTITIRYPANIGGSPGHTWWRGLAMATPIAHKGTATCAKVNATTVLDILMRPELVQDAWRYFEEEQTADTEYTPIMRPEDQPAIHLNKEKMDRWRPQLEEFYYDPSRYSSYLDQLGIAYPARG